MEEKDSVKELGNEKYIFKKYIYKQYNEFPPITMTDEVKQIYNEFFPKEVKVKRSSREFTPKYISDMSLEIGNLRFVPPFTKEDVDVLTAQILPEIINEAEKNFWDQNEQNYVQMMLNSDDLKEFHNLKNDQDRENQKNLEYSQKWEQDQNELKRDFATLMRQDMDDLDSKCVCFNKYFYVRGKAELWHLMKKIIDENFLGTINKILGQFASVLNKYSDEIYNHFLFHSKHAGVEVDKLTPISSIKSDNFLEKLKVSNKNVNASIMYWFSKDVCSCHTEDSLEGKQIEIETTLENTYKKFLEVSRPFHLQNTIQSREEDLYNLIKHFQKYSAFVKTALPRKVKFLETIEKLMIFELSKISRSTYPEKFDVEKPKFEDSIPCLCDLPNKNDPLMVKLFISQYKKMNLPHNIPVLKKKEKKGLFFHKNLKIREDFRNMIQQGLEKTELNDIWNYHFDNEEKHPKLGSPDHSEEFIRSYDMKKSTSSESSDSKVTIRISKADSDKNLEETISSLEQLGITISKLINVRDSIAVVKARGGLKPSDSRVTDIRNSKHLLSSARNSLTLIRRSIQSSQSQKRDSSQQNKSMDASRQSSDVSQLSYGVTKNEEDLSPLKKNDSLILFCKFLNTILQRPKSGPLKKHSSKKEDVFQKKVRISYIELLDTEPAVTFQEKTSVISAAFSIRESLLSTTRGSISMVPSVEVEEKVFGVLGDPNGTEHLQESKEFLIKRIDSICRLLKKYPYLEEKFNMADFEKKKICKSLYVNKNFKK